MSEFLDRLKSEMQEAQQRFTAAQQKFTATQAEFQATQQKLVKDQNEFQTALQEFQAYQTLVNVQTRKEHPSAPPTPPNVIGNTAPQPRPFMTPPIRVAVPQRLPIQNQSVANQNPPQTPTNNSASQVNIEEKESKVEVNKTEAVRELLRQHPDGMKPGDIWKMLQPQLSNRAYLYSVLKRLRDKGDARERRGKYFLNAKPETATNSIMVQ